MEGPGGGRGILELEREVCVLQVKRLAQMETKARVIGNSHAQSIDWAQTQLLTRPVALASRGTFEIGVQVGSLPGILR